MNVLPKAHRRNGRMCGAKLSPRSLFIFGRPSYMSDRCSAVLFTQCCVLKTLKYTKYSCGFQPCLAKKFRAAQSVIYILRPALGKSAMWDFYSFLPRAWKAPNWDGRVRPESLICGKILRPSTANPIFKRALRSVFSNPFRE